MVNSINESQNLGKSNQSELLISVPSRVWVRIRTAGKTEKFMDAVLADGDTFLFNIEDFCEDQGIQLSKEERSLCKKNIAKADKNLRPRLVK